MTEFKKGDRVVTAPGVTRSLMGTTFPEGTTGVIDNVDREDLGVVLGDVGFVALGFDQVERVPAPLDPSKVKAGDTVTVVVKADNPEFRDFTIAGEVYNAMGTGLYVGGWPVREHPQVTLTDHQPAPEPEPEWKPGTVALATTPSGADEQVMRTTAYGPLGPVWLDTHSNRLHESEVTDVRPLVVIDPAAVDVDALRKVWFERTGYRVGADGIRATLAHLGIEAS